MDVAGSATGVVLDAILAVTIERLRSLNDLHVETSTERLHVGDDQRSIALQTVGWQKWRELLEAKGGQDGSYKEELASHRSSLVGLQYAHQCSCREKSRS